MESDNDNTLSAQEARAQLRETFLNTINQLNGEACKILTYEQSTLEATFVGWKPDGSEFIVTDMKTPANIFMNSALLRTPDILAITFHKPIVALEER